jgi:hypothetical protein
VFERVDDSSGQVQDIYRDAAAALPSLAGQMTENEQAQLPDRLMPMLLADDYGLVESVVAGVVPLLPASVLERFDAGLTAAAQKIGPVREEGRGWDCGPPPPKWSDLRYGL